MAGRFGMLEGAALMVNAAFSYGVPWSWEAFMQFWALAPDGRTLWALAAGIFSR